MPTTKCKKTACSLATIEPQRHRAHKQAKNHTTSDEIEIEIDKVVVITSECLERRWWRIEGRPNRNLQVVKSRAIICSAWQFTKLSYNTFTNETNISQSWDKILFQFQSNRKKASDSNNSSSSNRLIRSVNILPAPNLNSKSHGLRQNSNRISISKTHVETSLQQPQTTQLVIKQILDV